MESFNSDSPGLCAGDELHPVLPRVLPGMLPGDICLPFQYSVPGLADGPMSRVLHRGPNPVFQIQARRKDPQLGEPGNTN